MSDTVYEEEPSKTNDHVCGSLLEMHKFPSCDSLKYNSFILFVPMLQDTKIQVKGNHPQAPTTNLYHTCNIHYY